eukprot:TRINITY_DN6469_c0_g1_i3.p1 TRINITY_DN6469_c0_g1~~TRINITY_DN6469_c0_g1_i3.p1  ORF type:complete len:242 (-),score=43.00 TRINITY_DN6469_c0_g1_i3:467-1192(-)
MPHAQSVIRIMMRSQLSGMPEVRLLTALSPGLAAARPCALHGCVRLPRFDHEAGAHALHFIPPDGEFELARYSAADSEAPRQFLFAARVTACQEGLRIDADLTPTLRGLADGDVMRSYWVEFPLPPSVHVVGVAENAVGAALPQLHRSSARVEYSAVGNAVRWKLLRVHNRVRVSCSFTVEFAAGANVSPGVFSRALVHYEMCECDHVMKLVGLRIIEKSQYSAIVWVQSVCNATLEVGFS